MENHKFAGFWIRVAAALVDSIILQVGLALLFIPIILVFGMDYLEKDNLSFDLFLFFLGILYYVIPTASKYQATLGKKIVGIYVINNDGTRISIANSIGRYFAYILSSITLLIGFMMAGWTKKKRALHDVVAGTYVVYGKPTSAIIKP